MTKYVLCEYYKNKTCKFMNDSKLCTYAHGKNDLTIVDCKFGSGCTNIDCKFNHGDNLINNNIYEIPIIIKSKKTNKKNIKNNINKKVNKNNSSNIFEMLNNQENETSSKNNIINTFQIDINNVPNNVPILDPINNIQTIKIINKDKKINEIVTIPRINNNDKLFNIIDNYYVTKYLNHVYIKNKEISTICYNNFKYIKQLNNKINEKNNIIYKLKEKINNFEKENINLSSKIKLLIDNKKDVILKTEKNILVYQVDPTTNDESAHNLNIPNDLYTKYINIYEIFRKYNFNYKLINIDEIRKYSKDMNIYKLKQRASKVFNYYQKYKAGIVDLLPVSKLIY